MRRQKFVTTAAVLAVAAIVAAFSLRKGNSEKKIPVQMLDVNDQPVSFDALKGKVLFVNNWASWCGPCIAEMPSVQQLKDKLKGTDVAFVMVSFDDEKSKAISFMEKRKHDFDIYFPGERYPFFTSAIPATFIVDKNGKNVSQHIGIADYNNDEILNQLKALANE